MRRLLLLCFATVALPAGANRVDREEIRTARREPRTAVVPGGNFTMGVDEGEQEDFIKACREELFEDLADLICDEASAFFTAGRLPEARRVYVSTFEIDRHEVTTGEYRACVTAKACDPRPLVVGDSRYIKDAWPIVNVTYDDAHTYCAWRRMRLPTEAEWEKAARGDEIEVEDEEDGAKIKKKVSRRWPWGMAPPTDHANLGAAAPRIEWPPVPVQQLRAVYWTADDSDGTEILARPGTHRWGRSPYQVADLSGNVSEWVADWFSEQGYDGLSSIDPIRSGHSVRQARVVRGGSFQTPKLWGRSYMRDLDDEDTRRPDRGFRCARSLR